MLANPLPQETVYLAGAGIDISQKTIAIDSATIASITNAIQESQRNLANGFAGLDAQSALSATVKVQYMTRDEANAQIIPQGVLAVISDSKALRFGDGLAQGGFVAGLGAESCVYVSPVGRTALENGQLLLNAYNLAKTITTIYGAALSATNRITVILGVGVYQLPAEGIIFASFIDIVGVTQVGVRVCFTKADFVEACLDVQLRNITLWKPGTGHEFYYRFGDATKTITFENLTFEGSSTDTICTALARTSGAGPSQINWNLRNVKTSCGRLCCSTAGIGLLTYNMDWENVQGGDRMFAASTTANRIQVTGFLRRVRFVSTLSMHFEALAGLRMFGCEWDMPMNYLNSGCRIEYTRFKPVAGTASLAGTAASQSCFVAHCTLAATNHATLPITNTAGATDELACNVRSDL